MIFSNIEPLLSPVPQASEIVQGSIHQFNIKLVHMYNVIGAADNGL